MSLPSSSLQTAEKSILDLNGKQIYLANGYVASVASFSLSTTTETPVLLITNGTAQTQGSPSIFNYLNQGISLTASSAVVFKFYLSPTISVNGTAVTPSNLRLSSANTSKMNSYKGPTISSNGTLIYSLQANFGTQVTSNLLTILDPGYSLLITGQSSATSTSVDFNFVWNEL